MTAQTTTRYAIEAVYEALTEDLTADVTKPRALASADLFRRGFPRSLGVKVREREARVGKTVFVALGDLAPEPGVTELVSEHLWVVTFSITRDYYLGLETSLSDVETTFREVADDTMKITDALCYPGALTTTVEGTETGLAGLGSLSREGSLTRVEEGPGRLVSATTNFIGEFMHTPT